MRPSQRVALRYASSQVHYKVLTENFAWHQATHSIEVISPTREKYVGWIEGKLDFYEIDELSKYKCYEDIKTLYDLWEGSVDWSNGIPVFEILESDLEPEFRRKGIGIEMYSRLADLAREDSGGPMFFIPNYCNKTRTSQEALRVWSSLTRSNSSTSVGDVVLMVNNKIKRGS
jgi:GNAT superfamily N-acetyltransferase